MDFNVVLSFKQFSDDKLVTLATTMGTQSKGNADYDFAKQVLNNVETSVTLFSTARGKAVLGGKDRIADRNEAKQVLIRSILAANRKLEDKANETGNPRIITDLGLELRSMTRTPKAPVTELEMPTLKADNLTKKGQAKLSWAKVKNAIDMDIRYKKKADALWITGNHTDSAEFLFTNLESDQIYEFQICAKGPNNISSDWTDSEIVWVT